MKKNGFTLIEMIAVVVILGLIMIIAVPAVTSYITSSNEAVYANSVSSMLQEVKLKYQEKQYGPYIEVGDIMIVPFSVIELSKGDTVKSPYGPYKQEQSYILIERTQKSTQYYVSVIDSTSRGMVTVKEDALNASSVTKISSLDIPPIDSYYRCNGDSFIIDRTVVFGFNNNGYTPVEYRTYGENRCSKAKPILIVAKG